MEPTPINHLAILNYHALLRHSTSRAPHRATTPDSRLLSRHATIEGRPRAGRDEGLLCPGGEVRATEHSSSTSAEEAHNDGSNYSISEDSFSESRVDTVDPSWESDAVLAGDKERESFVAEVMTSLGPGGAGVLAVRRVPGVATLRQRLLPLAKKLALMTDVTRRPVLQKYGLSTDVPLKRPDRQVSAFATKLQHARHSHNLHGACSASPFSQPSPGCLCDVFPTKHPSRTCDDWAGRDQSNLEQLGDLVRQLGACMVEVGLLVARLCDSAIPGARLEAAIWGAGSVKARLIHYHAICEQDVLATHFEKMPDEFTRKGSLRPTKTEREDEDKRESKLEELWQEWHYDYGILTVLTAPMFLSAQTAPPTPQDGSECERCQDSEDSISGYTGLRLLSRGVDGFVSVPPDCLIVQVGEAAQIAAGGKLAAVAHCVCRPPPGVIDVSRETFVTFLQPAWDFVLSPPVGVTRAEVLSLGAVHKRSTAKANTKGVKTLREDTGEPQDEEFSAHQGSVSWNRFNERSTKLLSVVPSLASRWTEGSTFAEFSRQTTGQYYGAHGRQSQRIGRPSPG